MTQMNSDRLRKLIARRPAFPVYARDMPGALPVPAKREVHSLAKPDALDRWSEDVAGVRPSALAVGDNVITMFDIIGEDFWTGTGVTAKKVASQLRAIGDRPVEVQINSPGGDVFEGMAIYNVLREHPQSVNVKIMGIAASAASIIAMAGNTVEIGAASFLMIHNCWILTMGNRNDLRDMADWLEPFDQALVDVYAKRTGQKPADIAKWLDDETYMSGSTAISQGFADALLPADRLTFDEGAQARERDAKPARAAVHALIAQGHTRADARAMVRELRGMPNAASDSAMPNAGAADWSGLSGLIETLRS
ncbi:head maturation protease, ClpP-related [Methylopila sp. 73B]|uniref:head maturation protease, ClpP-related n=1 Tax=Methylopila sp. 73B TaxID=1120792 RepID=UPI000374020C|nr:head maturation protease, ClpP-related [Methylopila sp. 73B]